MIEENSENAICQNTKFQDSTILNSEQNIHQYSINEILDAAKELGEIEVPSEVKKRLREKIKKNFFSN